MYKFWIGEFITMEERSDKNMAPFSEPFEGSEKDSFHDQGIMDGFGSDRVSYPDTPSGHDYNEFLEWLWEADPEIHEILYNSHDIDSARNLIFDYLERIERLLLEGSHDLSALERCTIRDCIRVLRNVFAPIHEEIAGVSAFEELWKLAHNESDKIQFNVSIGFVMEFIHLFLGITGRANIYPESREGGNVLPEFLRLRGRTAARVRMKALDKMGQGIDRYFLRYPSGLEEDIIRKRLENRKRILRYFDAAEEDWDDYAWQIRHAVCDYKTLADLIDLSPEEEMAVKKASDGPVPFGITPYYLSLIDPDCSSNYDHAIRAQVIPPPEYVEKMLEHKSDRETSLDFMGERDTSPVDLVTRRYPGIAIIKPFNTCAQICVYCQRNWEIGKVHDPGAMCSMEALEKALAWFDEHPQIHDVLITGGDPCMMKDRVIRGILSVLSQKKHIYRIRIGTRTPVVLPMRWTDDLVRILSEFREPGKREIAVVTHFEHSSEITPEAMNAVQKIRLAGMGVYNQEVFTLANSRRFETCKLRRDLRLIGVDPYYTFNMKGKSETRHLMVPIARILQERKEEARLLPGLDRTDEPVFNVPRLGKNHLRAWQDHKLVMIKPDGSRVYEFHPWEKNISLMPPYYYTDVPIYDYLAKLSARGEDIRNYKSIWYYV